MNRKTNKEEEKVGKEERVTTRNIVYFANFFTEEEDIKSEEKKKKIVKTYGYKKTCNKCSGTGVIFINLKTKEVKGCNCKNLVDCKIIDCNTTIDDNK